MCDVNQGRCRTVHPQHERRGMVALDGNCAVGGISALPVRCAMQKEHWRPEVCVFIHVFEPLILRPPAAREERDSVCREDRVLPEDHGCGVRPTTCGLQFNDVLDVAAQGLNKTRILAQF